eukprot:gene7300-416_t
MLSSLQRSIGCGSACARSSRPALAVQNPRFRSCRPRLVPSALETDAETPSSSKPAPAVPPPTIGTDAAAPASVEATGETPTIPDPNQVPDQEYPEWLIAFKDKYLGFMDFLLENRRVVSVAVAVADVAFLWLVIKGAK